MTEFCNNNKYLPLRFSVYSYTNAGDHPFYGSVICHVKDLEMLSIQEIRDKNGKLGGTIVFN